MPELSTLGDTIRQAYDGQSAAKGRLRAIVVPITAEADAVTAGIAFSMRAPYPLTLQSIRASLATASATGAVTIDVLVNGASILSTPLTIDQSEETSVSAAVQPVISTAAIADDAEISISVTAPGSGATGLKVTLFTLI